MSIGLMPALWDGAFDDGGVGGGAIVPIGDDYYAGGGREPGTAPHGWGVRTPAPATPIPVPMPPQQQTAPAVVPSGPAASADVPVGTAAVEVPVVDTNSLMIGGLALIAGIMIAK